MRNRWPIFLGIALAGAGIAVSRLDIGSPATGNIMQLLGFAIILWTFFARGGG